MAKLKEILGSKIKVDLEFSELITDETESGLPIVRLEMKDPIPVVYGRLLRDELSGESVRMQVNDVTTVSIGKDTLDEIEKLEESTGKELFVMDADGKGGRFTTNDLFLDVSNQGEVWVTKTKFAEFGRQKRKENRQNRNSSLVRKIMDGKTKKEFADVKVGQTTPEPVVED